MSITARGTKASENYQFSEHYKTEVFLVWYNAGKVSSSTLFQMVDIDPSAGRKPAAYTLNKWINEEFEPRAELLDMQVRKELDEKTVKEKVEMLKRHSDTGVMMQDIAKDYLAIHADDLTTSAAIRLLIEGVRIERESRGLPQALEKMMRMSDDELLEEVKNIVATSPMELESGDEETKD